MTNNLIKQNQVVLAKRQLDYIEKTSFEATQSLLSCSKVNRRFKSTFFVKLCKNDSEKHWERKSMKVVNKISETG